MLRRLLIPLSFALALLAPAAALASSAPKEGGKKDVGQYVDLQPVGMPVVVQGRLVNYVFVYVRLNLTSSADISRWRQREPLFRDALVRTAHRTPFTLPNDIAQIDAAKLTAALQREAVAITGPGVIRSVVVTSQAARGRAPPPKA